MPEGTEQRNPIEVLAEEFIERQRRGEHPTVAEYVDTRPDLADEVRQLFPMIVTMERVKRHVLSSSDRAAELRVGRLEQLGDYRIVREIGRGGMGIVYEAEQQSLGRRVAVKVFPRQALFDSKDLRRFRREARTAALLHHSNIVHVFGLGEQDGLPYYVMQFIPGIGLDKVIDRLKRHPTDSHVLCTEPAARPGPAAPAQTAEQAGSEPEQGFTASKAARALLSGKFAAWEAAGDDTSCSFTAQLSDSQSSSAAISEAVDVVASRGQDRAAGGDGGNVFVSVDDSSAPSRWSDRNYWRNVARMGVQVAKALRYAHAHGTLHRDVKPSNLLLDAQGTIWVTDFGLAKARAQENLSQPGDVVGTLRYMAPEQLRGVYDARSDIYSLGLTLYELLTLRPAYVETDQNHLIQRVSEGKPMPPRKLRPFIPRDLETIVLKAVARDPKHRYQTAGELAEDLGRFLDDRPIRARRVGPIERLYRWSRRNPVIAWLSAVLLIVVFGSFAAISWKWREAENENLRAETNLSLALDSMDQFLARFASAWMAHPSEPQDEDAENDVELRRVVSDSTATILQNALKFYYQFAEQNASNPRLRRDTAKAHRQIADIQERLGRYDEAESAYRFALQILEEQLGLFPNDPSLATDTAATLNHLALVLHTVGRHDDAKKHLDRAREIITEELIRSAPSPQSRYELARTYSNLGSVLRRLRERKKAADNHRWAIELLDDLVKQYPSKAAYRLALARAYRGYYRIVDDDERQEETARMRSEAISILDRLVEDFPNVPDYQCELCETLAVTTSRSGSSENVGEAEARLRRAVDLARGLTEDYPAIPRYRAALARALQTLGSLARETMRADEAEQLRGEAVTVYQSLAGEFPSVRAYKYYLATALHAHGEALRDVGRLPESRKVFEMAIIQQQSYVKSRPQTTFGRSRLAHYYESLAEALKQLGDDQQAEGAAQEAEKIRADLERRYRDRRR